MRQLVAALGASISGLILVVLALASMFSLAPGLALMAASVLVLCLLVLFEE